MLTTIINKFKPVLKKKSYNFAGSYLELFRDSEYSTGNFNNNAYCQNAVAHRCISMIAKGAASVKWRLYVNKKHSKHEIHIHPILKLLDHPNPFYGGTEFFENLYSYQLISGNSYIYKLNVGNSPAELHILHPDKIEILKNDQGLVHGYKYTTNKGEKIFTADPAKGQSQVLHIRYFNPKDELYGLSPLNSVTYSIKQHNQTAIWNHSMLKNGARPTGALILGEKNQYMTDEQFEEIRERFTEMYNSPENSGRTMLLDHGLKWQEIGLSPRDMDYIEGKNSAARDIALALGVPPQLLGIPGDSTYNNLVQARLALWEETILPMLEHMKDALNSWLTPDFGPDLLLDYDTDEINALSAKREKVWERIKEVDFMTINEKRKAVGLSPIKEGDKLSL